jgi:hypothetical protein
MENAKLIMEKRETCNLKFENQKSIKSKNNPAIQNSSYHLRQSP